MRVMLAYDGSACADAARDLLAALPLPTGSSITLVTALERGPQLFGAPEYAVVPHDADEAEELLLSDLQAMLHQAAEPLRTPDRRIDARVVRGRPASAIVDEARAAMPDLVVCGSRGHGPLASVLMGSVSAEIVDHAACPVLVARHSSIRRMVVGVDGSAAAEHALAALARWPVFRDVPAHLVTVAQPISSWADTMGSTFYPTWVDLHEEREDRRKHLRDILERSHDTLVDSGLTASVELREGDAADQLIRAASDTGADLIVVGSRGLSTLPRLVLGSVARKVLLHAPQSVLIVRQAVERVHEEAAEKLPASHAPTPA
jgi:nucleotide-binding universal stress UspA family protein